MTTTELNAISIRISQWRASKGFFTPPNIETQGFREAMLGKLMLVVTEVSEAAEAVRKLDRENFEEEIADTFIRLLDITGTMRMDISGAILKKMLVNETRPERHGKHTSL